jgi:protoporphyrinogen/coproporphyrinogen III oxidase
MPMCVCGAWRLEMEAAMPSDHGGDSRDTKAGVSEDLKDCRYAVVGGGLSGLAAAWYLQLRGGETHIFERDSALGGRAISGQLGDREVTLGGKNIGRQYTRFRRFVAGHGEHPFEHFGINSSRVLEGKVLTLDSNHRLRVLRHLRGISAPDLARLGRLVLSVKGDPDARLLSEANCRRLARRYRDRNLQEVFGTRLLELVLRSLTVRVSAAEPDEVPMANILPYVGMITDTYDQLSRGMQEVVTLAGRNSSLHLQTEVKQLILERGRVEGLRSGGTASGETALDSGFDGVVLATPAHASANLLRSISPAAASLLDEVRYFPVTVLLVEYERPVFSSEVRATVFGAESALSNAGAYGANDLNVVRYTFSGRNARSLAEREPDPEQLAAIAEGTLAPIADVSGNPRRAITARRFSPGLCAYHPQQAALLGLLRAELAGLPGVSITGDYLRGCSIEACFAAAEETVKAIPAPERGEPGSLNGVPRHIEKVKFA